MDRGSLVGYSPWGRKDLDTTEQLSTAEHREYARKQCILYMYKYKINIPLCDFI